MLGQLGSRLWVLGQASMGLTMLWPDSYPATSLNFVPWDVGPLQPAAQHRASTEAFGGAELAQAPAGRWALAQAMGMARHQAFSELLVFPCSACSPEGRLLAPLWRSSAWDGCQDPGSGPCEWPVWAQGLCHVSWWSAQVQGQWAHPSIPTIPKGEGTGGALLRGTRAGCHCQLHPNREGVPGLWP